MTKKIATVDKNVCVACGICTKVCLKGAVSIWRGCHAQVDSEKCVGCGLCTRACPASCIIIKERLDDR